MKVYRLYAIGPDGMLSYGMKAAAGVPEQLLDRAGRLDRLGLHVMIELHTFGANDVYTESGLATCVMSVARLRDRYPVRLRVHVPYQDPEVVTSRPFDREQVRRTAELADALDAEAIVVHRYWALTGPGASSQTPRHEAEAAFDEEMLRLSRNARRQLILVENLGHFWLEPRSLGRYLAGPLDHFFPWEMERFATYMRDHGASNVVPMVDIAHACITANMFNLMRQHFSTLRHDQRFQGITAPDLDQRRWLTPYDYVDGTPRYFHGSDAIFIGTGETTLQSVDTRADLLTFLTSEAMPVGRGNLDFSALVDRWLRLPAPEPLVIAEVNPDAGQTHERNGAQEDAIRRWRWLEREESVP